MWEEEIEIAAHVIQELLRSKDAGGGNYQFIRVQNSMIVMSVNTGFVMQ